MTTSLNFSERLTIVKCVFCTDKAKELLNEFPSPIVGRNRQFLTLLSANDSISLKICSEVFKKVNIIELMDAELIGIKAGANVEHCLNLIDKHNSSLTDSFSEDTMLERANLMNSHPLTNKKNKKCKVATNEMVNKPSHQDNSEQKSSSTSIDQPQTEPDPLLQIATGMFIP